MGDLYGSRFLARQLATRDIKSQYRQSLLGIVWAFIAPLSTAFVWIFLSSSGTVDLEDTGVPYPLYVFCGTLLWSTLLDSINMPLSNTNGAKGILSKINIPKEAIILSGLYKMLFNSSFKFILIVFFLFFYEVVPSWSLLLFPCTFLILIISGVSLGLLITPLGMLYTDVATFISYGLRFIMYVTPVVYVIPESGILKTIMEINPLTPLILVNRNVLLGLDFQFLTYFGILALVMIPVFLIALVIYRVSIPVIIERFSA
ncbi:ABC transporter permease [Dokdonia sinensis]|uniref:ABC transporter permease n=1 Tax=Dokdonia sinensis TaxID=2479847 RepID=UPI001F0309F2|nr:ABC transporter permease [Dokdonia sinensis]